MMLFFLIIIGILLYINPILGVVVLSAFIGIFVLNSVISDDGKNGLQKHSGDLDDDIDYEELNWELDDLD